MKDKYTKTMIIAVLLAIGPDTQFANADLVGHWGLDGNPKDSTGKNDGTIVGEPTWETGCSGRAIVLDGDDYIVLPNESDFDIRGPLTVGAWIKPAAPGKAWQAIVTKGNASWRLQRRNFQKHVKFNCNGLRGEKINGAMSGVEAKTSISDDQWYHVVGVYDESKLSVYVNGLLDVSEAAAGRIRANNSKVCIGQNEQAKGSAWNGLIDDVTIFNHALNEYEINQLYRLGGLSFMPEPPGLKLAGAAERVEATIKEQGPKKGIALIEKTIVEYEQWKEKNPDEIQLADIGLCSDLRILLADTMNAAGMPKQDIALAYKHAIESDMFFSPKDVSALVWLQDNTDAIEYDDVVESLIRQNCASFVRKVAEKAKTMIREGKSKAAIGFLEGNLAAHTRWRQSHPFDEAHGEDTLPEIYFQLAKAREAANTPIEDVADAYLRTFEASRFDYVPERSEALAWLAEHRRTDECVAAVRSFAKDRDTKACFNTIVGTVCDHFKPNLDGDGFRWFLDVLFAEAAYPHDWAIFMDSHFAGKTDRWAKAYYQYLESKPRLKIGRDSLIAERYASEEKYKEAAQLYEDILSRCRPEDDKGLFEYQLCRCLFYGGNYREAAPKLKDFISTNRSTHPSLAKKAMLMKAHAHLQLAEINTARDDFFVVIIEYPTAPEIPEADFFIGYCYMLQNNYEEAKEVFNVVVDIYPESDYASKAGICLARIAETTQ